MRSAAVLYPDNLLDRPLPRSESGSGESYFSIDCMPFSWMHRAHVSSPGGRVPMSKTEAMPCVGRGILGIGPVRN